MPFKTRVTFFVQKIWRIVIALKGDWGIQA